MTYLSIKCKKIVCNLHMRQHATLSWLWLVSVFKHLVAITVAATWSAVPVTGVVTFAVAVVGVVVSCCCRRSCYCFLKLKARQQGNFFGRAGTRDASQTLAQWWATTKVLATQPAPSCAATGRTAKDWVPTGSQLGPNSNYVEHSQKTKYFYENKIN